MKKLKLQNRKVKADYKKIIQALTKAGIMCAVGNAPSAFKEVVGLVTAFEFKPDPEDLAYQITLTALINATHNLAIDYENDLITQLEEPEKLYDHPDYLALLESITDIVNNTEVPLNTDFINHPRNNPILPPFQQHLQTWFKLFLDPKRWTDTDITTITNRLPTYFVFAFHEEWQKNYTKYTPLTNHINVATTPAAEREQKWIAYNAQLQIETERPVFGDSFGLKDIFISPIAYYEKKKTNSRRTEYNQKSKKIVITLQDYLEKWLNNKNSKDDNNIKVLSGGPGSGKSSFAKMWAAHIANNTARRVLFIPLHRFNIENNISDALTEHINQNEEIPFSYNPIKEIKNEPNILIIFDGLDELSKQDKSTRESAAIFIDELRTWCKNNSKIKILIAGRPIAVQNADAKLRGKEDQIIHLLPYYTEEKNRDQYDDPQKLLEQDLRQAWWKKYNTIKELPQRNMPETLRSSNLDKLTPEPLLNYLIALSWMTAPEKFSKDTNINEVYYQLIKGVYDRDYEQKRKHRAIEAFDFDDFLQILEEIALCAWQGGEVRITTVRKIETYLEKSGRETLLNKYKSTVKGGISRLLTAFYFRKHGKEQNTTNQDETFEFTHKSFGEYLAAKALVELVINIHYERSNHEKQSGRRGNKGWSRSKALQEWLSITGSSELDDNIITFIKNEWHVRQTVEGEEELKLWLATLTDLISYTAPIGMPTPQKRLETNEERRQNRNAEESILIITSTLAAIIDQKLKIRWQNIKIPSIWLLRLKKQLSYPISSGFRYLSRADLSGADLSGADLSGATLSRADLRLADLRGANLRGANLRRADLSGAYLREATLRGADLRGADLRETTLREADLSGANLRETTLREADLREADLRGVRELTIEQLNTTRSLHQCPLPDYIDIKKIKPALLKE